MRFVHHHDGPTSTASRLVPGDLFHFESLKRSRNVILSDVVQGRFLGEVVGYILCQALWQTLRHFATVVGFGTGLAALYRNAPASIRAENVGG